MELGIISRMRKEGGSTRGCAVREIIFLFVFTIRKSYQYKGKKMLLVNNMSLLCTSNNRNNRGGWGKYTHIILLFLLLTCVQCNKNMIGKITDYNKNTVEAIE